MTFLLASPGCPFLSGGALLKTTGAITPPAPTGPAATSLALDALPVDQIHQRAGTSKSITFSGTYTGTANTVQARIVDANNNQVTPWATLDAAPANGVFSGSIAVPQGCWYKVQVRDATNTAVGATSLNRFGVGMVLVLAGQSNMVNLWASSRQSWPDYPLSDSRVRGIQAGAYGRIGNYDDTQPAGTSYANGGPGYYTINGGTCNGGDGMVYFANQLAANLAIPIAFVMAAVGNTTAEGWQPGQTLWNEMIAKLDAVGGDCEGMLWNQGENNGGNTAAAYGGKISPIHAGMLAKTGRTTANFAFGIVVTGPTGNYGAEGSIGPIREAQVAYLANAGVFLAGVATDSSSPDGDQVHIDNNSQIRMGYRYAKSITAYLAGSPKPGPRITGATRSGAVVTVAIAGGTGALKDGAGGTGAALKGFRVFAGGVAATISSTVISGSSVVITLAAVPSGAVTLDYAMANLAYGTAAVPPAAVLYDSDTVSYANANIPGTVVGLPLLPCAAIPVTGG